MASISKEPNGRRRILFVAADGKRRTIRLGKVSQRTAEAVKVKVEALNVAKLTGQSVDDETARWLANLDGAMLNKLAAVGLASTREKSAGETLTLAAFIDQYIAGRPNMKPNTAKNYHGTRRKLVAFFGLEKLLAGVTPGDADDWKAQQEGAGLAPATIGRDVKRARQFFRAAVRRRLIAENPFADVKAAAQVNKTREYYVTRDAAEKIVAACPDGQWRLIVALARYGGLRTPSETFALCWGDIDWERGRIRVRSPKTAHHPGGESRIVPLFPELRPHLEQAFDAAEPGTEHVVTRYRNGNANLRTQLERIIRRAGLTPWPRPFQNMRASRETELTHDHPLHVVVAWIGNSAPIAARHYLQVTDGDYERAAQGGAESGARAAQNAAQQPAARKGIASQESSQVMEGEGLLLAVASGCDTVHNSILPPRGVEPLFPD